MAEADAFGVRAFLENVRVCGDVLAHEDPRLPYSRARACGSAESAVDHAGCRRTVIKEKRAVTRWEGRNALCDRRRLPIHQGRVKLDHFLVVFHVLLVDRSVIKTEHAQSVVFGRWKS
jgi:hypothetical protein